MKHLKTKVIAWLLTLCTVFGLLPLSALAAPLSQAEIDAALADITVYNDDTNYTYLYMGNSVIDTDYVYFKPGDTEIPAYCITPTQYGIQWFTGKGEGISYTLKNAVTDPKVLGIIIGGYPPNALLLTSV